MNRAAPIWIPSAEAAARSGTFRLLARLWLREVDRELVGVVRSPLLGHAFVAAGGVLPPGDDEAALEQLAIDYCRLFIGPVDHLPPFQSVWQSGQLQGTTSDSMKQFTDVVGFDTGLLTGGTMLDHLGVQLDVMGHILAQVSVWQPAAEGLDDLLQLTQAFFAAHLMWPVRLLQAAAGRAETEFYRGVIKMTSEFLESEFSAFTTNL